MKNVREVLLETKRVPELAIRSAEAQYGDDSEAIWKHFVNNGNVTESDVFQALAKVNYLDYLDLRTKEISSEALAILSSAFCRREQLIPVEVDGEQLIIGTPYPDNFRAMDEISSITYHNIVIKIVSPTELKDSLDRYLRSDEEIDKLSETLEEFNETNEDEVDDLSSSNEEDTPVVRFVNLLIAQAIQDRASDIHVEPGEKELRVRYRIDGVLHEFQKADKSIQKGVVSRLKVMSDIDIGEKRKPQDGRLTARYGGQPIDIRVVTLPTTWGEKVVMRILDHSTEKRSISSIGMSPENEAIFNKAISSSHGMILVTGPTGSGKALPLNTKIPTADGFTTMGEINTGDKIFGENGKIYSVTSTSEINTNAEMFEITFSDGQKVITDADHQWLVSTAFGRAVKKSKRKETAVEDYLKAHQAFTKLTSLSLEFTPEFGKRTSEELLTLIKKEKIQHYSSAKEIEQALHMVDVIGNNGVRPSSSLSVKSAIEYSIEEALMGLARRIRQQHAVIQSKDTPVVRITTLEMMENGLFVGKNSERKNYAVPINKALDLPEKELLIDPYILGLWLGDGSKDSGRITIGKEDQEDLLKIIEDAWGSKPYVSKNKKNNSILVTLKRPDKSQCVYGHDNWVEVGSERKYFYCQTCGTNTRNSSRKIQNPVNGSLGELLAHLGIRGNKHIPMEYLRSSFEQRINLLQGLIDSDGYVNQNGSVELCFSDRTLTEQSVQLIRSLGIKVSVKYDQAGGYINKHGEKIAKIRHRISFTTNLTIARLTRKRDKLPKTLRETSKWNYIRDIKPLGVEEAAKCISVNSPDFTYLVGEGFIVTSNSTTIYTALDEVAKPNVNVVTVEDPVEKKIAGISQMQINNKAGMTFSNALRSILRADPDIIFLGEIRDEETAKIAVDASMTGHLVLSTLHTNGAPEAAARLSEMGVEPYLVGSSVTCVVAQRLARKLCSDCKEIIEPDAILFDKVDFPYRNATLYRPKGCSLCSNTGYRGRVALTEIMEMNEYLEPLIIAQKTANEIRHEAEKHGFVSLREDGWDKVRQGLTTIEEVLRVAS